MRATMASDDDRGLLPSFSKNFVLAVLLLLLTATPAKNLSPEARPSPLSGLNSVGTGIGEPHGELGRIGSSYSQVWMGTRHHRAPHLMNAPDEVTATIGGNAFLPCSVQHLGDRTVTWMRQHDLHILTAGPLTFSADERFRVLHPEDSDDWTLHIKVVTPKDAGLYECQVNSDPKISREVTLKVKEHSQLDDPGTFLQTTDARLPDYQVLPDYDGDLRSRAGGKRAKGMTRVRQCRERTKKRRSSASPPTVRIEGPEERYIQEGSVLALTCLVTHRHRRAPAHLLWFRGTERLDYNSPRGGVSVQTEKMASRTLSRLMISAVKTKLDSGEYSCSPTDLPTAVVTVHVQRGQHHAAVHQSVYNSSPWMSRPSLAVMLGLSLLALRAGLTLPFLHPDLKSWSSNGCG